MSIAAIHYVSHFFTEIKNFLDMLSQSDSQILLLISAIAYFFLGLSVTLFTRWLIGNIAEKQFSAHYAMLFRRIILYVGLAFTLMIAIKSSGIDVSGILGAAGIFATIFTAGLAFAAQTSLSNFLSGIFLVAEKPFVIGDYVNINNTLGEVLSIDLLSVKIRTKDNTLVRIPNETLLKSQFQNVSHFPIRRLDVPLKVSFAEDIPKLNKILMEVASQNPLCLISPAPEVTALKFSDGAISLQFSVWCKQASAAMLLTLIQIEIHAACQLKNIRLGEANPYMPQSDTQFTKEVLT